MSKVYWNTILYEGYKEDPLPTGKTLLYLFFKDNSGKKNRWTPPWKDLEEVFIKAIDVEKRNYPEGAWDEELKKVVIKSPSRPHDIEVFKKSDSIMNEKEFRSFFNNLKAAASYRDHMIDKFAELYDFFSYEGNKYISKILYDSSKRLLANFTNLTKFTFESDIFFEVGPESNIRWKLWPAYIVINKMGIGQEQRDQQFREYFDELKRLVEIAENSYIEYRSNIRGILFI